MAVLFDLDGTILGSYRDKNEVRNECVRKYGVQEIDKEKYFEVLNEVLHNSKVEDREPIFRRFIGDEELSGIVAEEYEERSLENVFVYPDAEEVLPKIKSKKGIVTNGPRLTQWGKIRKFELEKYFDSIVVSGEVGKSKPGKEIFQIALRSLKAAPGESLYVGNVPHLDVKGAENAGLVSVLIDRDGNFEDSEKVNPKPDYIIGDLRELYGIVDTEEIS